LKQGFPPDARASSLATRTHDGPGRTPTTSNGTLILSVVVYESMCKRVYLHTPCCRKCIADVNTKISSTFDTLTGHASMQGWAHGNSDSHLVAGEVDAVVEEQRRIFRESFAGCEGSKFGTVRCRCAQGRRSAYCQSGRTCEGVESGVLEGHGWC